MRTLQCNTIKRMSLLARKCPGQQSAPFLRRMVVPSRFPPLTERILQEDLLSFGEIIPALDARRVRPVFVSILVQVTIAVGTTL